jgi:PhzF family phenazine biosynthesis protein
MKLKIYQIDAFTDTIFGGNPAAVCPLEAWLPDDLMQQIASENNLAETAFYVPYKDEYLLRWFTPTVEVDLCGHATLAAAFVLFNLEHHAGPVIRFNSP